ncbi:MAG: alpha/beta fold hydrolase [Proteobacteria bacterium]|nr:alpha/beta fold hydrolase [Pseudomonadota bacterium]
MPFFQVSDGCRLHVEIRGAGDPVLLISGLGGMSGFWCDIEPIIARRFRTISFDQRGTGKSDRPGGRYTIERIVRDTVDLLDILQVDQAHIVGHSTGGLVAQHLAITSSKRVRGLVLSGTWSRPDERLRTLLEVRRSVLELAGPECYSRLTCLLGYAPSWLESNAAFVAQAAFRAREQLAPLPVALARIQMLIDDPGVAHVASIAAPALVCGAIDDMIIPFQHSQQLAQAIPAATLLQREGGHFFPQVKPNEFAADVLDFIGREGQ